MRRLICAGAFGLVTCVSASAQTAPQRTTVCPARPHAFPQMAYDEDTRYHGDLVCQTNPLDRLEFIPLSEDSDEYDASGLRMTGKWDERGADVLAVKQSESKPGRVSDGIDPSSSFWSLYAVGPLGGLLEENIMSSCAIAADSWSSVPTKKASIASVAPALLPFFNNGPVFGLPGTEVGDFPRRTQLSGDWGGLRTDLARHGLFFDLYSTSAYQNVASGGLKAGNAFIQNTQLSINVDTGRAGLWSGGIFHITLESRYGSSAPQNSFTVGSTVPQYTGLAIPGPFFVHDVLPTEYLLFQSLTPKFAFLLGKANVLKHADQTFFGNSYRYYFANLNFNKIPMALNFFNTTSLAAVGFWMPSKRLTVAAGVFDPNSEADNLAAKAFDRVNVYGTTIFSYTIGDLPGQSWVQANWTNKPKIDLTSPFGQLSPSGVPQAVGVLLGTPPAQALPVNYKDKSWVTLGNFSQYLFVKDDGGAVAEKLGSGQALRGIGLFGRIGYAPQETNPITRHASVAVFANGLSDHRPNDSVGLGIYHNGISQPLKNDIARLTEATATLENEQGLEVFYDVAITPAIRLIPSYQHIWNPTTARVAKNERGADVFLLRWSLTW